MNFVSHLRHVGQVSKVKIGCPKDQKIKDQQKSKILGCPSGKFARKSPCPTDGFGCPGQADSA
jgi:hypothetical protein